MLNNQYWAIQIWNNKQAILICIQAYQWRMSFARHPHKHFRYRARWGPQWVYQWAPIWQTTGKPLVMHPRSSGWTVGCHTSQIKPSQLVTQSSWTSGPNYILPLATHWSCTQDPVGRQWVDSGCQTGQTQPTPLVTKSSCALGPQYIYHSEPSIFIIQRALNIVLH